MRRARTRADASRRVVRAGTALALAAGGLALAGCASDGDVRDLEYLAWVDAGAVGSVEYSYVDESGRSREAGTGVTGSSWVHSVRGGPRVGLTVTPGDAATAHCAIVDRSNRSMLVVRNGRVGESITCAFG